MPSAEEELLPGVQQVEPDTLETETLGVGQVRGAALALDEYQAATLADMLLSSHEADPKLDVHRENNLPAEVRHVLDFEPVYRFAVERPELLNNKRAVRQAYEAVIGVANAGLAFTDLDRDKLHNDYVYQMQTRHRPGDKDWCLAVALETQEYWEDFREDILAGRKWKGWES